MIAGAILSPVLFERSSSGRLGVPPPLATVTSVSFLSDLNLHRDLCEAAFCDYIGR